MKTRFKKGDTFTLTPAGIKRFRTYGIITEPDKVLTVTSTSVVYHSQDIDEYVNGCYAHEMIPCDEKAVKVYDNILGYKVVVIPHLKQVRLFQCNKEVVKVQLSDDEIMTFDPVYGFLMAYAKHNTKSNTLLQEGLEKLRHDPLPEPKVKKVDDPIVWISHSDKRIRLSDLKSLETNYIVNIVKLILRQGLSPQTDFDIEATVYLLNEAHVRNKLKDISVENFRRALLPF